MAKKISELTAITTIADNDLTPIVDTSETETKKMTASQMKTYAQNGVVLTADIKDNLTSTDTNKPLSANQGKVLNDKITNLKTYSTSEIDTGEIWDNGKHIFRRTIKSTTPNATYTWLTLTSGLNADVIFKYYGYYILSSSEMKILPFITNSSSIWFQKNSSNEFQVATSDSAVLSKTLSVTIEYTKIS